MGWVPWTLSSRSAAAGRGLFWEGNGPYLRLVNYYNLPSIIYYIWVKSLVHYPKMVGSWMLMDVYSPDYGVIIDFDVSP